MKKYYLIIFIVLLLTIIFVKVSPRSTARRDLAENISKSSAGRDPAESAKKILVGGKKVSVEIADTPTERKQGLSDRKNLCSDCGLLFIFDTPGIYPFWMKRMYFDIDILWISGNKVADITFSAVKPLPEDFDNPKVIYQSKMPVDKVLEVNAGWVEKNGVKIDDAISAD